MVSWCRRLNGCGGRAPRARAWGRERSRRSTTRTGRRVLSNGSATRGHGSDQGSRRRQGGAARQTEGVDESLGDIGSTTGRMKRGESESGAKTSGILPKDLPGAVGAEESAASCCLAVATASHTPQVAPALKVFLHGLRGTTWSASRSRSCGPSRRSAPSPSGYRWRGATRRA